MGVTLGVVTDPKLEYYPYNPCEPRKFCDELTMYPSSQYSLGRIINYLDIDLTPFTKLSNEAYSPEDRMNPGIRLTGDWEELTQEEKGQHWDDHFASIESSYQEPQMLLAVLDQIILALETDTTIYTRTNVTDPYFTEGRFGKDVQNIKNILEWAITHNIKRVRFEVS